MPSESKKYSMSFRDCLIKDELHPFYLKCLRCNFKCYEISEFIKAYRQYELEQFHKKFDEEYYD